MRKNTHAEGPPKKICGRTRCFPPCALELSLKFSTFLYPFGRRNRREAIALSNPIRSGFSLCGFVSRRNSLLHLPRPFNGTVKFLTFPNQPGGVTAVKQVAPSKRNR